MQNIPNVISSHYKEIVIAILVAIFTAVIGALFTGAYTVIIQKGQIQNLQSSVERLEKDVGTLNSTLRKWSTCEYKEDITGKRYSFYWDTLECMLIEGSAESLSDENTRTNLRRK